MDTQVLVVGYDIMNVLHTHTDDILNFFPPEDLCVLTPITGNKRSLSCLSNDTIQ